MATHKANPVVEASCFSCGAPAQPSKAYSGMDTCPECEKWEMGNLDADEPEEAWKPQNTSFGEDDAYGKPYDMHQPDEDIPMRFASFGGEDDFAREEARQIAYDWHGGQWSPLYAFASSGIVESKAALEGEIEECMTSASANPHRHSEKDMEDLHKLQDYVSTLPEDVEDVVDSTEEYGKNLIASLPTPEHMKAKTAMKQGDMDENVPKLLGKPGEDWDATNYFDNRDLSRKFYSQFFEGAVLIADDGTYYQVLQLVAQSGNFVAMLQDVLYPQIVFTIGVPDLLAHIWKWISPYDVVVNPDLAPASTQSVSDIVSVGNLEKPAVPDRWLSY